MSFWNNLSGVDIVSAYTTRLEQLTSISETIPAGSFSVSNTPDPLTADWALLEDGWRGLDAPILTLPASDASVGLGEQFLKWWPQPREITIPLQRRETASKDTLDRHLYSSSPLVVRFSFAPEGETAFSRFFIASHAISERPITLRKKNFLQHNIRFRSEWPFFVGSPEYQTADLTAPSLQGEAIWGYHVTGATIGTEYEFTTTPGTSPAVITVRASASEFLVSPSFPFEENVVITTGRLIPDYLRAGTTVRAVSLSGGASARLFYLPNYASLS